MAKRFLISSRHILRTIEEKLKYVGDLGLTKWDIFSMLIEYVGYNSITAGHTGLHKYLQNYWILEEATASKIVSLMEFILSDLAVYSPELIDILSKTDNLAIVYYDKHVFILEKKQIGD